MAPVLREHMDGVPWLDISFDGQGETNVNTRLEAFMHQSLQFHRRWCWAEISRRPNEREATDHPVTVVVRVPIGLGVGHGQGQVGL